MWRLHERHAALSGQLQVLQVRVCAMRRRRVCWRCVTAACTPMCVFAMHVMCVCGCGMVEVLGVPLARLHVPQDLQ